MSDEVREWCRVAWGVPVVDTYSAEEVGYIALQCPAHEHYHVQAESVLVEILDERGAPCTPGQIGRVVITDLHNFATPLVRYDIGDYAEVGEPCPCGRTLPVLRRILGRVRNVLIARDGRRYWPAFGSRALGEIAAIRQHQFVQKAYDLVEARLVVAAPLMAQEEERLRRHVLSRLPEGFRLQIVYRENIPRGAGGKFEEFVSEIPSA
jgi:phenylacetate-CoA ligase